VHRRYSACCHLGRGVMRALAWDHRTVGQVVRCYVTEMHSEFVICALAHSGGARNSWGFHRNPFCEPIRFLGLGRRLCHTGWDEAGRKISFLNDRSPRARVIVREMHSEFVICALAHPGGARNSWGFHRNPFCERIRFLGLGRGLCHTSRDAMSADTREESPLLSSRALPCRPSSDRVRADQRRPESNRYWSCSPTTNTNSATRN